MKKIFILTLVLVSAIINTAQADNYPTRPIKIITSLPAGSGPDSVIRGLTEKLSKKWHTPVVIENRPGGLGVVALNYYNSLPADGYSIFYGDASNFISYPILYNDEKIINNIEPVAPLLLSEMMLITSSKNENFTNLKSAIAKNPNFGSWGIGSPSQIASLELSEFLGISTTHIPYKDYGTWFTDTAGQTITFGFATIGSSAGLEQAGKLKFIAYTGNQRDYEYPNVPTLTELTGKKINIVRPWTAFYINKSVPDSIKMKLQQDLNYELNQPDTMSNLLALHYRPWNITLPEFKKFLKEQSLLYKALVNKYNINLNN